MKPNPCTSTWYLLYDGSSTDGRGSAKFIGRTLSEEFAKKHNEECKSSPYSFGYVEVVTNYNLTRMS
jgi:hypothetical protein